MTGGKKGEGEVTRGGREGREEKEREKERGRKRRENEGKNMIYFRLKHSIIHYFYRLIPNSIRYLLDFEKFCSCILIKEIHYFHCKLTVLGKVK